MFFEFVCFVCFTRDRQAPKLQGPFEDWHVQKLSGPPAATRDADRSGAEECWQNPLDCQAIMWAKPLWATECRSLHGRNGRNGKLCGKAVWNVAKLRSHHDAIELTFTEPEVRWGQWRLAQRDGPWWAVHDPVVPDIDASMYIIIYIFFIYIHILYIYIAIACWPWNNLGTWDFSTLDLGSTSFPGVVVMKLAKSCCTFQGHYSLQLPSGDLQFADALRGFLVEAMAGARFCQEVHGHSTCYL
jgi:hypothetical protein